MSGRDRNIQLSELVNLTVESMAVAVTIIDTKGTLLYYNPYAAKILDRQPAYIGTDIHSHHKKTGSNQKVKRMLEEFKAGRTAPFYYEATPYGKTICVTLSPLIKNGEFVGCVQTVRLKNSEANNV